MEEDQCSGKECCSAAAHLWGMEETRACSPLCQLHSSTLLSSLPRRAHGVLHSREEALGRCEGCQMPLSKCMQSNFGFSSDTNAPSALLSFVHLVCLCQHFCEQSHIQTLCYCPADRGITLSLMAALCACPPQPPAPTPVQCFPKAASKLLSLILLPCSKAVPCLEGKHDSCSKHSR